MTDIAWGVCTTAKAPPEQVLAFVGHHLSLGAAHIWVHLDNPDDAAFAPLAVLSNVTPIRCDAQWWGKRRPDRHQNRQSRNMQRIYAQTTLPWVAHLDVDEFIDPDAPIADVLATADRMLVRMRPWEALQIPRTFRAPVKDVALRTLAFGDYAPLLPDGALSHTVGKAFFRTGIAGLEPRIHGAFLHKERVTGIPFEDRLPLLHFHAEDPVRWRENLRFRLSRGAYQFNPALQVHLAEASDAEIDAFYATVQSPEPDRIADLASHGLIRHADLNLTAKTKASP